MGNTAQAKAWRQDRTGRVWSSSNMSLLILGRNCKLSSSSLSMAAVDILYIDITRRWNSMTLDQRDSGTRCLASTTPCGESRQGWAVHFLLLLFKDQGGGRRKVILPALDMAQEAELNLNSEHDPEFCYQGCAQPHSNSAVRIHCLCLRL